MTDALVKCASYLGFVGDIFMGLWDDSKYVAGLEQEFAEKAAEPTDVVELHAFQAEAMKGTAALKQYFETHTPLAAFWDQHKKSLLAAARKADKDYEEMMAAQRESRGP